jgi:uncharacterized membrane protein
MERTETERTTTWVALISTVLCVAGVGVATYLTYAHYTTAKVLACSDKGLVNCERVTTSTYSHIVGLPVSDLGLGYFLVMAALCSPWAWRSTSRVLRGLRVLAATSGVGMILWLVYAELFRLDAICLYCTAVHVITVLLFVTVALGTAATGAPLEESERGDEGVSRTVQDVASGRWRPTSQDRASRA